MSSALIRSALNILGCLDQPTSGSYEIDGLAVKNLSKNELANIRNQKIGFIFQAYNLLPRTSAIENVELPLLYNSKITAIERRERAILALEKVGLGERLYHTPSQLSGGQQQRVAIARSLVNDPVTILADEATGNLDTRTSYEIMSLFQELNAQGITITFVTHEPDIATFSSRTLVLKDGNIIKKIMMQDLTLFTESSFLDKDGSIILLADQKPEIIEIFLKSEEESYQVDKIVINISISKLDLTNPKVC